MNLFLNWLFYYLFFNSQILITFDTAEKDPNSFVLNLVHLINATRKVLSMFTKLTLWGYNNSSTLSKLPL